ncbi:MAG: diacylglycerol kinase family protein [Candidatus Daviesbacteria bacterium]|nr:diacylglycerol kinase family protein [Candidatus Daviesbacteria bacterium]
MDPEKFSKGRVLSFRYAITGIITALKEEPNLKFHFLAGVVVIIVSLFLKISKPDFIIIIFLIGFVISVELTNTAIEAVVDKFTDKEHPGAKLAKDISAGAVLIAAITSTAVGTLIFLPYLSRWAI